MPDPTQHSLPDVPDEAVEDLKRSRLSRLFDGRLPDDVDSFRQDCREDLEAALPSLHAAFEKDLMEKLRDRTISAELLEFTRAEFEGQPNVLSKEEAELAAGALDYWSRKKGMGPRSVPLIQRLSDWAEERTGK